MLRLTDAQDSFPGPTLTMSAGQTAEPLKAAAPGIIPAGSRPARESVSRNTVPVSTTKASAPVATTTAAADEQAGPERAVVSGLLRIAQRVRSILNQGLADSGLNEVRLTVMQVLQESSPAGCSQAELADALQQSESSVSTLVERMRSDGLLYRLRSNADRRKRVLMLTSEGRDLLEQVEAVHAPRMRQLLSVLPEDDVHQLRRLIENLADGLAGHQPLLPEAESHPSRSSAA